MTQFLHDDDSFKMAVGQTGKSYFFAQRLARVVAAETDTTFFTTLQDLGVGHEGAGGDILEDEIDSLNAIEKQLSDLMLNICIRKAISGGPASGDGFIDVHQPKKK